MADPQRGVPACAARASSSSSIVSPPRMLPGGRSQYPANMTVDFTRLRPNALRKYMAFHGIAEVPGSSQEQLAVTVARHFNEECKKADECSSITSFITYLTGSSDTEEAAELLRARPAHLLKRKTQDYGDDKENQSRQVSYHNADDVEALLAEADVDDLYDYDYGQEDDAGLDLRPFVVKKRRPANQDKQSHGENGRGRVDSGDAGVMQKKKKRKGRLYCICKGASFGNMIACDNKRCLDRSNWYHMSCVGLDPLEEPPETWYCPACQENDCADIPENRCGQYRKPVASVTYGDMISHALTVMPGGKGSFKEICDFVEAEYESQLNWKLESDQRKSPVWKSSVRKILFSNVRFRKHPEDKGMFCLAV